MNEREEQLVRDVVAQVLARLQGQQQQGAAPASPPSTQRAVAIRPPVGVCTGDYSKFVELQGRSVGAAYGESQAARAKQQGGAPAAAQPKSQPDPIGLSGIITADQLQAAMDAAADRVAVLAADARLTPLANDLARLHPERIRRANADANPKLKIQNSNFGDAAGGDALPWLWWSEGFCPVVQSAMGDLRTRVRPSAAPRSDTGFVQVVRDLDAAVRNKTVQGGLLFVERAAVALCYANRVRSLRAVAGTGVEAVEDAIAQLGANVLIIEYPRTNPEKLQAMVERFVNAPAKAPANVERHLAELHGRG